MTIYGVSQSSGVERRLKIEMGAHGLVLTFIDHVGGKERQRILVPVDDLLAAITEAPGGGCTVEGISPPNGPKMQLQVEVRRNEVLLQVSALAQQESTDVAVGLDDLQDAMEGVIHRA
jgi:hypothetical protein